MTQERHIWYNVTNAGGNGCFPTSTGGAVKLGGYLAQNQIIPYRSCRRSGAYDCVFGTRFIFQVERRCDEHECANGFSDTKLINYLASKNIHFEEVIVISVNKNYNIDYLLKRIKFYQTSKNVYVVGHTNAGKSSLINKLIKNYSDKTQELTMSPLPSTTLNTLTIEINDYLTLIDTPGLVDTGSILNHVDEKMVKKISAKKEIKPRTYQLRHNQSIVIEDMLRIDYVEGEKNSFTLFISNDLKVKRLLNLINNDDLKDKNKITYDIKYDEDLVINGLGFIKIVNKGVVDVYIDKDVETFTRKSLI